MDYKVIFSAQILLIGIMFAIMITNRFFLKDSYFVHYAQGYNIPVAMHLIRIKIWKIFSAVGILLTLLYYLKFKLGKYNLSSWMTLHTMAISGIWIFFFPNIIITTIHIITMTICILFFTL